MGAGEEACIHSEQTGSRMRSNMALLLGVTTIISAMMMGMTTSVGRRGWSWTGHFTQRGSGAASGTAVLVKVCRWSVGAFGDEVIIGGENRTEHYYINYPAQTISGLYPRPYKYTIAWSRDMLLLHMKLNGTLLIAALGEARSQVCFCMYQCSRLCDSTSGQKHRQLIV